MIKSMTGYGRMICELPNKKINIEIRSLNSRQLDINIKIPPIYKEKEVEIRNILSTRLDRGKIELSFNIESSQPDRTTQFNIPIIEEYFKQLHSISSNFGVENNTDFMRILLTLPDTLKVEQAQLDEKEWEVIINDLNKAIDDIDEFRIQEGEALGKDIMQRAENISKLLIEIEPYEEQRIERIKSRIKENINEVISPSNFDENRLEQELIFYIEKLDVSEEKTRLKNHLIYFIETAKNESNAGKKLGFITQEIGREINTLGAKANDADMQKIVIQMKDELEKIKEQILNIL